MRPERPRDEQGLDLDRAAAPAAVTDRPQPRGSRRSVWVPALIVGVVAAVYANSLSGPFVFDDIGAIVENPHVRRLWPLSSALAAPAQATVAGRPVVSLSLALNHAVGGLDVRGYHAVNIAIHALCALLLQAIVRATLGRFPGARARASGLATIVALLWAVHPLCTETVNYVIQRTESIMSLFYLLTLYCAIRAADGLRGSWRWTASAVAASALGMASKEAMVTAPVAVLLYDWAYRSDSLGQALRERRALYAGLAATWGVLAALTVHGPRSDTVGFDLGLGALDYARNQAGVVLEYLGSALWPHPLVFDYGYARPLATGSPPLDILGILAALLLATGLWGWRPALGYPALWVLLVLAPTSSFVPIVSEVGAERRMYLPLAGLIAGIVGLGWAGLRALERIAGGSRPWPRRLALGLVVLALVGLGWGTHRRNRDYRDAVTLWQTAIAVRPQNPRAHNNLGHSIHRQARPTEAIAHYLAALALDPDYSQAHFNLGVALADLGRTDEAIASYRSALERNPRLAAAHVNLGSELANRGRLREAIPHFRDAVRCAPDWSGARHKLGRALRLAGESGAALEQLKEALRLDPLDSQALAELAWILATDPVRERRDGAEAVRLATRALESSGGSSAIVLDALAAAYAEAGRYEAAVQTGRRAREAAGRAHAVELEREIAARLELYGTRRPYREPTPSADTARP